MVDPFRDPASVASLLEAAAQASARVLEIGSARGFFAVDYARERPTELFVASEVRSAQLRRLIRRAQKAGVENLRALLGDVRLQLPPILEAGLRFDRIFILFPDPWWKRRHRKRRLFQPGFPAFLRSALAPAGRVILKTDVEAYRAEVIRLLETTGHLRPEIPEAPTALPASRRERELSKAGLSIFELSLHPLPEPTAQEAEPQGTP